MLVIRPLNQELKPQTHHELAFPLGDQHHVFGDVLHDGLQVGLVVGRVVLLRQRLKRQRPTEAAAIQSRDRDFADLPTAHLPAAAATGTGTQRRSPTDDSEPCGSPAGSAPSDTWPACVSLRQTDKQILIYKPVTPALENVKREQSIPISSRCGFCPPPTKMKGLNVRTLLNETDIISTFAS